MKFIKSFSIFESEIKSSSEQDPNLEDFRFYRGSVLQFKQYWDKKAGMTDNKKVEYQYPHNHTEDDKSLPYQDFANGESALVKSNMATRRKLRNDE
jgi:hypothetical protein